MSLKAIREVIRKESVRQLSDNVPPVVYELFINEFVERWTFICLKLFREIEELLEKLLNDLCTKHFGRFLSSGLLRKVRFNHLCAKLIHYRQVTEKVIKRTAEDTKSKIRFYCKMERCRPFTLSHDLYKTRKADIKLEQADMRNKRNESGVAFSLSTQTILKDQAGNTHSVSSRSGGSDNVLLGLLLDKGYPITTLKQLACLHNLDQYDAELDVISRVVAYFEISSTRIIDVMPMIFETSFVSDVAYELRKVLISDLELILEHGFETCKKYVKDEPDIQSKRADYKRLSDILSDAMSVISSVSRGNT